MSVRKASVLELATAAYDLDATVLRGRLTRSAVGHRSVSRISMRRLRARPLAVLLEEIGSHGPYAAATTAS